MYNNYDIGPTDDWLDYIEYTEDVANEVYDNLDTFIPAHVPLESREDFVASAIIAVSELISLGSYFPTHTPSQMIKAIRKYLYGSFIQNKLSELLEEPEAQAENNKTIQTTVFEMRDFDRSKGFAGLEYLYDELPPVIQYDPDVLPDDDIAGIYVVSVAFEVAPNIYFRGDWRNTTYSQKEFTQEAMIYIWEKYSIDGYFDGLTPDKLAGRVIGMLSGRFIQNKLQTARRSYDRVSLIDAQEDGDHYTNKLRQNLYLDNTSTPAEVTEVSELMQYILDHFSEEPFKTVKPLPLADLGEGVFVEGNERLIAELLLSGYTPATIASEIFKQDDDSGNPPKYYSHTTHGYYIGKRAHAILKRINEIVNSLPKSDRELLEKNVLSLRNYI